jgi:hypothetical protein
LAVKQQVAEAERSISNLRYDGILTRFTAAVEAPGFADASPDPKTAEYYFECIDADGQPDIRAKLVGFLHTQIAGRKKNQAILGLLDGSLREFQIRMSDEAQVATYYFMTLVAILENNPEQSAIYKKHIALRSRGERSYFDDIFGAEFDSAMFSLVLTAPETDTNLQQSQQDALARLYDALKRST